MLFRSYIEMQSILDKMRELKRHVVNINALREQLVDHSMTEDAVRAINRLLQKLSQSLTWACYTYTDRFEQDSYAYTPASKPIPMLYHAVELSKMNPESLEYKLNLTEALRNRNRVSSAVSSAVEYCELYLALIDKHLTK